jgi:NitT/TauT family transport system ATP-binding protein
VSTTSFDVNQVLAEVQGGQMRSSAGTTTAASPATACAIDVREVSHHFRGGSGSSVHVLDRVSLSIAAGQFTAFVGPSGCGKTTLLNMIARLLAPVEGELVVLGRAAGGRPDRRVGYMFARDGLIPWRTAEKNVTFGLEIRRMSKTDKTERRDYAHKLLADVGLAGFEHAYPAKLSQGMRQRVAMARTLAIEPQLILLDEPFAALDAHTRTKLQAEFLRLWEKSASTVVMVTHDIVEALLLADRIIVFSARPGRIIEDIAVTWPRPREIEDLRYTPEFTGLASRISSLLRVQDKTAEASGSSHAEG